MKNVIFTFNTKYLIQLSETKAEDLQKNHLGLIVMCEGTSSHTRVIFMKLQLQKTI